MNVNKKLINQSLLHRSST